MQDQVTESALSQFIDGAAGVAINRASEAGGFGKGVGTTAGPDTRPQRLQISVVFFNDFSKA